MAEISFFATIEDHIPLIELLIKQYKAEFFLDGGASSEPPIFKSVAQVINVIHRASIKLYYAFYVCYQ